MPLHPDKQTGSPRKLVLTERPRLVVTTTIKLGDTKTTTTTDGNMETTIVESPGSVITTQHGPIRPRALSLYESHPVEQKAIADMPVAPASQEAPIDTNANASSIVERPTRFDAADMYTFNYPGSRRRQDSDMKEREYTPLDKIPPIIGKTIFDTTDMLNHPNDMGVGKGDTIEALLQLFPGQRLKNLIRDGHVEKKHYPSEIEGKLFDEPKNN